MSISATTKSGYEPLLKTGVQIVLKTITPEICPPANKCCPLNRKSTDLLSVFKTSWLFWHRAFLREGTPRRQLLKWRCCPVKVGWAASSVRRKSKWKFVIAVKGAGFARIYSHTCLRTLAKGFKTQSQIRTASVERWRRQKRWFVHFTNYGLYEWCGSPFLTIRTPVFFLFIFDH